MDSSPSLGATISVKKREGSCSGQRESSTFLLQHTHRVLSSLLLPSHLPLTVSSDRSLHRPLKLASVIITNTRSYQFGRKKKAYRTSSRQTKYSCPASHKIPSALHVPITPAFPFGRQRSSCGTGSVSTSLPGHKEARRSTCFLLTYCRRVAALSTMLSFPYTEYCT